MNNEYKTLECSRYHLHEQEQQLENNGGGDVGEEKYCGIEKVVQVT